MDGGEGQKLAKKSIPAEVRQQNIPVYLGSLKAAKKPPQLLFYSVYGWRGHKGELRCLRSVCMTCVPSSWYTGIHSFISLLNWILGSWLRGLTNIKIAKAFISYTPSSRRQEAAVWGKKVKELHGRNIMLFWGHRSSVLPPYCLASPVYQGQKYYKLCHSFLDCILVHESTQVVIQILESHPKEKLRKIESISFYSLVSL